MGFWDRFRRRKAARAQLPASYNSYYASSYGMPSAEKVDIGFDQFAQIAYGSNAVVFAVENRRMEVFSEATFKFRSLSDKHLFGNPDLAKLETPWPDGSTGDLLSRMEQDAAFAGNAYIRDAGDRLERLRPDWVTIVSEIHYDALGNQVREVIGYAYDPIGDPDREPDFFPVDEVAHWAPIPDPCANFRGMSWLTPVIREVNADVQMAAFRDAFFANAATANLIVKYQQKVGPERITALREMIATRHTGATNAFGTLVFDEGGDPTVVGSNMEGAAFDALQAAGETRIAAAGGVPAIVAGLRQGMQESRPGEYQAALRALADLTMRPRWRSACAALAKLVTVPAGTQLWYDTTDVSALQQGEKDKADTLQQMAVTANTLIMAGYKPDSVTAALSSGDFSLLVHSGLVSVQMQQLSAPTAPTGPPGDAGPKAPAARSRGISRRFDPAEPRDPRSGEWIGSGAAVGALKDALKLADRIDLKRDERLAGSGRLNADSSTGMDVVWAAIDSPHGREIRIGTVHEDDVGKWRAAEKGATAPLSAEKVQRLTDDLSAAESKAVDLADEAEAIYSTGKTPSDPVLRGDSPVAQGSVDSEWGPIDWSVYLDDSEPTSYVTDFKVGGNESMDPVSLDADGLTALVDLLDRLSSPAARSVTSHSGNAEQLHHYWTRGEGLAKWAQSPHPWTTLYEHLVKFMPPEEAKRTAAEWFHDVFHFWPGSDKNRVLHGHPPRGKRVGVG